MVFQRRRDVDRRSVSLKRGRLWLANVVGNGVVKVFGGGFRDDMICFQKVLCFFCKINLKLQYVH